MAYGPQSEEFQTFVFLVAMCASVSPMYLLPFSGMTTTVAVCVGMRCNFPMQNSY